MKPLVAWTFFTLYLINPFVVYAQEYAADAFFDPMVMEKARQKLWANNGGQINYLLIAERLEYQTGEGDGALTSEMQGWVGTDYDRLWVKGESDYLLSEDQFEELELQALYSKPLSAFFDLQVGVRQDFKPRPNETLGVLGIQGLAPYWFEIDLAYFLGEDGHSSFRMELEHDLLLTQRLILQPRAELNFAVQNNQERGVGSGLSNTELELRLRYEIKREFAPYIGVSWAQSTGNSADFARMANEEINIVSFVAGIRVWL
jgi:copper resistance protein B